jgi:hypothetical protein
MLGPVHVVFCILMLNKEFLYETAFCCVSVDVQLCILILHAVLGVFD